MLHENETGTVPDLTQLKQLARDTHDRLRRVHARAHRLCGYLNDRRSETSPGQQEDGWFYAVQRRESTQWYACPPSGQRLDRSGRRPFGFDRPPGGAVRSSGG